MPASRLLSPGAFRHRVTLVAAPSGAVNELGEVTGNPRPVCTVWAAVLPLSGRELLANAEVQMAVSTEVHIRYRPGVTSAMTVVHDGVTYDIESIIDVGMLRAELVLLCNQRTA